MGAEETAALVSNAPTQIEEIEQGRRKVLADPEAYRSYESAFYGSLPDKADSEELDQDERLRQAVGRFLLGQVSLSQELIAGLDDEMAHYIAACADLDAGQWSKALINLAPILEQRPDCRQARVMRIEALAQLGELEAIEEDLKILEKHHPDSPDVQYVQGFLREVEGDYEEANRLYWQTLTVDAEHQRALFRLAYHESLRGESEAAIELYERLCNTSPVPIGGLINLGLLFEDAEDYSLAASCLQRVLDFDPNHALARHYHRDAMASTRMYYDEERERKEDKRAQVLRIPVTDFELSVRSRNCLANMNVRTLGDLIRLSEQELLAFKNFGETSLTEIKEILDQKGLRLGLMNAEEPGIAAPAAVTRVTEGDRDVAMLRPIIDLELSVRSRKALEFLQIRTISDLANASEARLMACKNFGQTSLAEIRKKLRDIGLSLKES